MRTLLIFLAGLGLVACRTDRGASALESAVAPSAPPAIAPAPNADEDTNACTAKRLWKYADLAYLSSTDAAKAMKDDPNFPGAEFLGRFASAGAGGEAAPTYLLRDSSSCNILISVRGTANGNDAGTDANFVGGRNDGLLAKLAPGVAHRGFANAVLGIDGSVGEGHYDGVLEHRVDGKTLLEKLDDAVKACKSPRGPEILVTGHSLGGAVASLIHFILIEQKGYNSRLVTYGSPRVISSGAFEPFARAQKKYSRWGADLRVAGTNDGVTYVPPAMAGFVHLPGDLLSVFRGGHTGATYGYGDSTKYLCENDVAQSKAQRGEGVPLVDPGCLAVVLPSNTRGATGPCEDAVGKHQSEWYQIVSTNLSQYWTCAEMLATARNSSSNPLWLTEWDKCRGKVVRCVKYMNDICPFPTVEAVDGLKTCAMRGDQITDASSCVGAPCQSGFVASPAVQYLNGSLWHEGHELVVCSGGKLKVSR